MSSAGDCDDGAAVSPTPGGPGIVGTLPLDDVYTMDAREGLRWLAAGSVDCVVTSPPYWSTRDYGGAASAWSDGWTGALGLEPTVQMYLDHLGEVFSEVRRVLKDQGTLWVNLGDVYAGPWSCRRSSDRGSPGAGARVGGVWQHLADPRGNPGGDPMAPPVQPKSLCLVPERFAIRMTEQGWMLRNHIVWYKPNHLPASARDRFACSWEHVLFLVKSATYAFDLDAVRLPHQSSPRTVVPAKSRRDSRHLGGRRLPPATNQHGGLHPLGKNPGDCWTIPTRAGIGGHPAAFPEALVERPILAGCPPGGLVIDPFMGSGTTAVVARRLGRRFIGFDASPRYVELARARLESVEAVHEKEGGGGAGVAPHGSRTAA
jgi:DNA modification methylase